MGTIIVSNRQVSVVDPVKALRCLFTNRSGRERALNCLTKPWTNALYLCHRGRKQWSELIPVCRRSGTLGLCLFRILPLSPHISVFKSCICSSRCSSNTGVFPWLSPPEGMAFSPNSHHGYSVILGRSKLLEAVSCSLGCSPTVPPTCAVKPSQSTWNEWKNKMKLKDITAKVNREMISSLKKENTLQQFLDKSRPCTLLCFCGLKATFAPGQHQWPGQATQHFWSFRFLICKVELKK